MAFRFLFRIATRQIDKTHVKNIEHQWLVVRPRSLQIKILFPTVFLFSFSGILWKMQPFHFYGILSLSSRLLLFSFNERREKKRIRRRKKRCFKHIMAFLFYPSAFLVQMKWMQGTECNRSHFDPPTSEIQSDRSVERNLTRGKSMLIHWVARIAVHHIHPHSSARVI